MHLAYLQYERCWHPGMGLKLDDAARPRSFRATRVLWFIRRLRRRIMHIAHQDQDHVIQRSNVSVFIVQVWDELTGSANSCNDNQAIQKHAQVPKLTEDGTVGIHLQKIRTHYIFGENRKIMCWWEFRTVPFKFFVCFSAHGNWCQGLNTLRIVFVWGEYGSRRALHMWVSRRQWLSDNTKTIAIYNLLLPNSKPPTP